ncbi:MAG: WecB/TagA/CpsF family glycosyltransferase [Pseudomonadota bacterium]
MAGTQSKTRFAAIEVDAVTYEEMFVRIDSWLDDKTGPSHHIAPVNAYCASLAARDPELQRIWNAADIAGADGMPFVYWIRWVRGLPCDRLDAPDIVEQLAKRAETKDYAFYLYGGAPEVLEGMKEYLLERFPYLRIVGAESPPFRPLTEAEDEAACRRINEAAPDIICVGLGTPKQDYWIRDHLKKIRGAVFVGCGATFDFFGGRVKRAPQLVQLSGLEWLYRLLGTDRQRLWKRYTLHNIDFLARFGLQLLTGVVERRRTQGPPS